MPKCDFNKVANHTSAWMFCCKFNAYFQNTFSKEHLWWDASDAFVKAFKVHKIPPSITDKS